MSYFYFLSACFHVGSTPFCPDFVLSFIFNTYVLKPLFVRPFTLTNSVRKSDEIFLNFVEIYSLLPWDKNTTKISLVYLSIDVLYSDCCINTHNSLLFDEMIGRHTLRWFHFCRKLCKSVELYKLFQTSFKTTNFTVSATSRYYLLSFLIICKYVTTWWHYVRIVLC